MNRKIKYCQSCKQVEDLNDCGYCDYCCSDGHIHYGYVGE